MVDPKFAEDLTAELAILNTGVLTALRFIALLHEDPEAYVRRVLEDGQAALRQTNYFAIPADRQEALAASIEARWADLVTQVLPGRN